MQICNRVGDLDAKHVAGISVPELNLETGIQLQMEARLLRMWNMLVPETGGKCSGATPLSGTGTRYCKISDNGIRQQQTIAATHKSSKACRIKLRPPLNMNVGTDLECALSRMQETKHEIPSMHFPWERCCHGS